MAKLHSEKLLVRNYERDYVRVANISLISSIGIADGKMLPVIFLDCSNRPDIEDLLINHSKLKDNYGKINTLFGRKSYIDNKFLYLVMMFKIPYECNVIAEFDINQHAAGIDLLVKNQVCYIQSNSKGNRIAETMNEPRVIIEVPSDQFTDEWEKIYFKVTTKRFTKKGYKKEKAKELARNMITELRKIDIRME